MLRLTQILKYVLEYTKTWEKETAAMIDECFVSFEIGARALPEEINRESDFVLNASNPFVSSEWLRHIIKGR